MSSDLDALVVKACEARERAYAPYSRYKVGAALLTADGEVYTGCNVENAVYPLTCCAERVAMFAAIAAGARHFQALAVATENGGSPCGSCRQVMREFAPDMVVLIADTQGNVRRAAVSDLLPDAFGPEHLPVSTLDDGLPV